MISSETPLAVGLPKSVAASTFSSGFQPENRQYLISRVSSGEKRIGFGTGGCPRSIADEKSDVLVGVIEIWLV